MHKPTTAALSLFVLLLTASLALAADPLKALIVEGQNNHGVWPRTSQMMKSYLEQTDLFTVDIVRTAKSGTDPEFKPAFADYNVVVSNYNGAAWPSETQQAFVDYMAGGGGFVVVHAANNSFGNWKEYNEIIGLGGWGGRTERVVPMFTSIPLARWSVTSRLAAGATMARSILSRSLCVTPSIL